MFRDGSNRLKYIRVGVLVRSKLDGCLRNRRGKDLHIVKKSVDATKEKLYLARKKED